MRKPINKLGNLEIENNLLKFRMPLHDFKSEDINVIEKNFKRKLMSLENAPFFLIPSQIEIVNSNVIFYYELTNYHSFDYLRQLDFKEKLKYYSSLIEVAKLENQTKVIWDRSNSVVDPLEEKIKFIVFETDDLKIHEQSDSLKGIKDLILVTLTVLNVIVGRPNKSDFIDKDNHIIQFAEMILKIDNLEDLEHYINTIGIEQEHGSDVVKSEAPIESAEKKKLSILALRLPVKKKKVVNNKVRNKKKKQTKKNDKTLMIGLVVLAFAFIFNFVLAPEGDSSENKKEKELISDLAAVESNRNQTTVTTSTLNDELLSAYRYTLTNEPEKAVQILETIGYENLGYDDQIIYLRIQREADLLHKVIDIEPEMGKEVVNELITSNRAEEIIEVQKNMSTVNPYIEFEVAYLNQDWETVLEWQDKIDLNGRNERQIVDAYIGLTKYNDAEKFAQKVGNPALIDEIKMYIGN